MTKEENVQRLLRSFELWSEGDLGAEWVGLHDPDVVVTAIEGWPEGDPDPGIDGWRLQAQRLRSDWERAVVEIEEARPVGSNGILARIRYVTETSEPGVSFDTPMNVAARVESGRIVRIGFFWDADEALAAAEQLD